MAVTGPVARFARQIAGQGYIVAAPSSYHEFTGPEPLAYDVPGTDAGNEYKITKVCFTQRQITVFWVEIMFWTPMYLEPMSSEPVSNHPPHRPSKPTMKTPPSQSITCSPLPPAMDASAAQVCVSVAISPTAAPLIPVSRQQWHISQPISTAPLSDSAKKTTV